MDLFRVFGRVTHISAEDSSYSEMSQVDVIFWHLFSQRSRTSGEQEHESKAILQIGHASLQSFALGSKNCHSLVSSV